MGSRDAFGLPADLTTGGQAQIVGLGTGVNSEAAGLPNALGNLSGLPLREMSLEYDARYKALWCYQNHRQRPNFTSSLIGEIGNIQDAVGQSFEGLADADEAPIKYLIWASRRTNIFNLGGDLTHFVALLEDKDRAGMAAYARSCIDICYANYVDLELPICTVALASGDALGGGLESALTSDVVVVEKSAQFGFPEILFGLFPGMGAYSLVQRRAGQKIAEEMILSGRIYRGEQLFEMGLADVLAPDGEGEAALHDYLRKHDRKFEARRALADVRRRISSLDREELDRIGELWVDRAMALGDRDIKKMRRLAKAQLDRLERQVREQANSGSKPSAGLTPNPRPVDRKDVSASQRDIAATAQKDRERSSQFKVLNISSSPLGIAPVMPVPSTQPKGTKTMNDMSSAGQQTGDSAEAAASLSASASGIYEQILDEVAEARAAATLQPSVERMLSEGLDRAEYLEFLEQLYHVVWHFCPTMAAAAARCGDHFRDLRYALYHNIEEEKGHESWVLDDIADLGGNPGEVAQGRPAVPVQAMVGYNYYVADRENPWAVLGMVHVLEEISANYGGRVAAMVAKRLGINDGKGFRFLGSHGLMDVSHVDSFRALVDKVKSGEDVAAIVESSKVNYALFGALFREA